MPPAKKRKKFGLKEALLIVAALVLILVAAEAAVRLWHPWPRYPRAVWADRAVGRTYKPGLRTFSTNHWREFVVPLHVNSLGFRDVEPRPTPDGRAIVFLGDSFTAAQEVPRTRRWTELVVRDIARQMAPGLIGYNFAISGYGPIHHWLVYRKFVSRRLPHRLVIVLAFAGNDFQDVLPDRPGPRLIKANPGYRLVLPTAEYVARQHAQAAWSWYNRFHLYNLVRDYLDGWLARRRWKRRVASWDGGWDSFWKIFRGYYLVVARVYQPAPEEVLYRALWRGPWGLALIRRFQRARQQDVITRGIGPMTEAYRRLRDLVRQNGAKLLVVIMPHRRSYGEHTARNDHLVPGLKKIMDRLDFTRPSRRIEAILRQRGIAHVDLTPVLIKLGPRSRPLTWPKDGHLTAQGNAWLARQVIVELRRRGLLERLVRGGG